MIPISELLYRNLNNPTFLKYERMSLSSLKPQPNASFFFSQYQHRKFQEGHQRMP
jgi:hypothetical protein